MKIYYSHSTNDYWGDTEHMQKSIIYSKLKELNIALSNIEIINPKNIQISEEDIKYLKGSYPYFLDMMRKYYFKAIDGCSLLCAFKDNKSKKYTHGVELEIEYAKISKIKVIEL